MLDIYAAMDEDPRLARAIGRGDLEYIGAGGGSVVFKAPREGRVVRLTNVDADLGECQTVEFLAGGRKRTGWPRVYDAVRLESLDDGYPIFSERCLAVVERVFPAGDMDRRTKQYRDIVAAARAVKARWPFRTKEGIPFGQLSPQGKKWALQLEEGLRYVNRAGLGFELDLYNEGNWGLDGSGDAVWVDFGV